MQRFILHVLSITPLLVPKLLQHPSIIPPVNHFTSRIVCAFITRMNFIGKILRDGQSPHECLLLSKNNDHPIVIIIIFRLMMKQYYNVLYQYDHS